MTGLQTTPFRGRFEIKIDQKGRLSLPPAYRQVLPTKASPKMIITNSRYRGKSCLHVYGQNGWHRLEQRINRLSALKSEVQAFNRFYMSGGQVVEFDGQNRLLIPQSLRRYAGLETQVVLVGMGEKFEIWSEDHWTDIYEELTLDFEDTLQGVALLDNESQGASE